MADEGGCKCLCSNKVETLEDTVRLLRLQVQDLECSMRAMRELKHEVENLQAKVDGALVQVVLTESDINHPQHPTVCPQRPVIAATTCSWSQPSSPSSPGSSTNKSDANSATPDFLPTVSPSAPPSYEDVIAEALLTSDEGPYRNTTRSGNPASLQEAAEKGYVSSVETLLRCGASSDKEQLNSALVVAGSLVILEMLLDAGADPNSCDSNKCSALHWAAQRGHEATVAALLRAGSAVEAQDKWGNTPLHVAAQCDQEEVVKVLLSAGAEPHARNSEGWTPRDLAKSSNLKLLL